MRNHNTALLLQGNLRTLLVKLSLPGIAGMLLIALNGLMDAFFVSRLVGQAAFAGVTLALPLLVLNSAVTSMLSSGAALLYSRQLGRLEHGVYGRVLLYQLLCMAVVAAACLALLGCVAAKPVLYSSGGRADVLQHATLFYKISCAGCFPSVMGLCISGLLRAGGQFKKVMVITGVTVLLNLVLHPLLIQWLGMGTGGAAVASVISMSVYMLLTLRLFLRLHPAAITNIRLQWHAMKEILLTGLPALLMQLNGLLRQFVLFRLVMLTAANIQQFTFFAAVYRLFSFAAIPAMGVLQALQPVLGASYGAGNYTRVKKAKSVFCTGLVVLMVITAIPGLLWPQQLLLLLLDKATLQQAPLWCFRLVLLVLPLMPFASTGIVLLQATGQRKTATAITGTREVLLFLPLIYTATAQWGYAGVFYGLFAENVLYSGAVWLLARYAFTGALRKQQKYASA
ncbi:Na+-driven multidrug efflux pump [Filimonas zeae]|uniref:MATE family efflux transporter n=1 Tax=Filimonas zeae TaxID=1737353 RepID=A0A917J0K2_9BACT|nr:MATE family efflux transporter [Filimonas zeae]MDR6340524.1 Na+-driven multidrug efflux pump [Filimonas zeae]GGH73144.1 MATE family efflux transporter [Filimonas zeae]